MEILAYLTAILNLEADGEADIDGIGFNCRLMADDRRIEKGRIVYFDGKG